MSERGRLDEVEVRVEEVVRGMPWVTADVLLQVNGVSVKEERTAVLLGHVRGGVKPLVEELLRAERRIAELEEPTGGRPC